MAADAHIRHWIETEFRGRCQDDAFIAKHARVFRIGQERGDDSITILRAFLASVMLDLAGMPADERDN